MESGIRIITIRKYIPFYLVHSFQDGIVGILALGQIDRNVKIQPSFGVIAVHKTAMGSVIAYS